MAFGGNSINAVLLDGTQTIFGAKTFSTTPKFPTQAAGSNNTYGATTAFVSTAITNAITADCVTLTGAQTIGGVKTFTSILNIEEDEPKIKLKNSAVTKGTAPSENKHWDIYFTDGVSKSLGYIEHFYSTNKGSSLILYAVKSTDSDVYDSCGLAIQYGYDDTLNCAPTSDNLVKLGALNKRWTQLYAGTATINTSDEREKQQIADIPENVIDAWADVNFCQFKFNDSVAEKGDAARLHTGLIAQRIKSVFEAHGLDAAAYGLFCHDSWSESEDVPAGDRYALRYEECLTLEAAYQRRRADRIEKRLEALEKALNHD